MLVVFRLVLEADFCKLMRLSWSLFWVHCEGVWSVGLFG